MRHNNRSRQTGNIFFALFGAIALVGLLGAGVMTFMRGPLQSAVKITRQNTAEAQMSIAGQVAVMAAAGAANNGDCDTDGFVEPLEWRVAGVLPKPANGGLIPNGVGINKKDPWGTEYGYCVWDHGPTTLNAACEITTPGTDLRLQGANSRIYPVVAIISAGPDKTFTTTCRNFSTGADRADQNNNGVLTDAGDRELVGKALPTDDDVIFTYSYEEATGASGGLWQLKSSDPNVATIGKSLEVTGGATFQGTGTFQRIAATGSDFLDVLSGLRLPTSATMPTCNATNQGVLRRNVSGTGLEICSTGNVWTIVSGEGASDVFSNTATCTSVADRGKVRYDSVGQQPQFCNGTAWQPFTLGTPTAQIIITPASNYAMDTLGPCVGGNCPYAYTSWQTFTVINQGGTASAALNISAASYITGPQAGNFEMDVGASTCDNNVTLAANGGSCTVVIRGRANSNGNYTATINVSDGSISAFAPLYGTSTGFGCSSGARGWGGIVVGACTGPGGTSPGTGQLIVQEAGCGNTRIEPTCTGDPANDANLGSLGTSYVDNTSVGGPLGYTNYLSYLNAISGSTIRYCDELVKDGYDNWFLPHTSDFSNIIGLWSILSLSPTNSYHTSDRQSNSLAGGYSYGLSGGATLSGNYANAGHRTRCFRYHNQAMPTATVDNDPIHVTSAANNNYNERAFSSTVSTRVSCPISTIRGINTPITISVFGEGSPAVRINGGAEVTSGTLNNNDTIELRVTSSPTAAGEVAAQFQAGTDSAAGRCRVQNQTAGKTIRMFVTNTPVDGNLGGLSGADATCQAQATAASLPSASTYLAWLAVSGVDLRSRLPNDALRFENMNAALIANNVDDLVDGTISNPINRTANNTLVASGFAWTGSSTTGGINSNTCGAFTSTISSGNGGNIASVSGGAYMSATGNDPCTSLYRFYCFGPN